MLPSYKYISFTQEHKVALRDTLGRCVTSFNAKSKFPYILHIKQTTRKDSEYVSIAAIQKIDIVGDNASIEQQEFTEPKIITETKQELNI